MIKSDLDEICDDAPQRLTTPTEAARRADGDKWLAQQADDFKAAGIR